VYLVGEVEKRGLLMVSLEWMMQLLVKYSVAGGEIGPGRKPPLYSSHGQCPAKAG
jgi:hypothetical protein